MFYVTITARRKNAKRHIAKKCQTFESAIYFAHMLNPSYIIEIFSGDWKKVF